MIIDLYKYIALCLIIWLIGISGVFINRKNILIIICSLELTLLSLNLLLLFFSIYINTIAGEIYSLILLTVAAAESAIGLAILISYYRLKGSIQTTFVQFYKFNTV